MKYFLAIALIACLHTAAQSPLQLVVQKNNNKTRLYTAGRTVKLFTLEAQGKAEHRGRLRTISPQGFWLQPYHSTDSVFIPLDSLQAIKTKHRTARLITGIFAGLSTALGLALIVEDQNTQDNFFPGLGTAVGTTFITNGALVYLAIAATEPQRYSRGKGHRFSIVPAKQP